MEEAVEKAYREYVDALRAATEADAEVERLQSELRDAEREATMARHDAREVAGKIQELALAEVKGEDEILLGATS